MAGLRVSTFVIIWGFYEYIKVFLATLLLICNSGTSFGSDLVQKFNFSYVNGSSKTTGSFSGIANGDLITNLSDISVFSTNGIAYQGNGNLAPDSWSNGSWVVGGAVASFSGKNANMYFINSTNPMYPNQGEIFGSYLNAFSYVTILPETFQATSYWIAQDGSGWNVFTGTWTVTPVPEPETFAMMLLGLPLMGWVALRRKRLNHLKA